VPHEDKRIGDRAASSSPAARKPSPRPGSAPREAGLWEPASNIPKPSKCDRCHGVSRVLTGDLAYFGNRDSCQSCGAAAFWERSAAGNELNTPAGTEYCLVKNLKGQIRVRFVAKRSYMLPDDQNPFETNSLWEGLGGNLRLRKAAQRLVASGRWRWVSVTELTAAADADADGFYDIDGTWLSAEEMLGNRNSGRKKNIRVDPRDGTPSRDDQDLGDNAEKIDHLTGGGWHVRHGGSTGKPAHRPVKGITDQAKIDAIFRHVARTSDSFASYRYEKREEFATYVYVLRQSGVNVRAMAALRRCHRDTIYRLAKLGEQSIRHKSPNRGGGDLTTLEAQDALARIEMRQGMHGEALDYITENVRRLMERLDEEFQRAIELDDAYEERWRVDDD
jgi:hypothetical protein